MSISRQPCKQRGFTTIAFLVDLDKTRALVLDNYVWAVAVKEIPIAEWKKNWQPLQLTDEKVEKVLAGLRQYALYAGMTPQAAEYLPLLTPMSPEVISVATHKGRATLERFKTQAAAEEASEKHGKKLTGAALAAVVKKELAQIEGQTVEPDKETTASATGLADRRRASTKAKEARKLAQQVTEDLQAAEQRGENPVDVLKTPKPMGKVRKEIKDHQQAVKQANAKPFDPAKLKGDDGEYKSASAMFKGLLLENKGKKKPLTDDEIFAKVKAKFGLDDSKRSYVAWNRNWLKKEGQL